jgi:hypothetical protein
MPLASAGHAQQPFCQPTWSLGFPSAQPDGVIYSLAAFDDDNNGPHAPALYAGGRFKIVGGSIVNGVARWDSTGWSPLHAGVSGGDDTAVYALAVFDPDGPGPQAAELIVGGTFAMADGIVMNGVARWNGSAWGQMGSGMDGPVYALAVVDFDGAGPEPPVLFAGGNFMHCGAVPASRIARWAPEGGGTWLPVGSGMNSYVLALCAFDDDGDGPHTPVLYAGGSFYMAGDVAANRVARWDNLSWQAVGLGTNGPVYALATYDADGAGAATAKLCAGGAFTMAGGAPASFLGAWDGAIWAALGSGVNGPVWSLHEFDADGAGPDAPTLQVGGSFTMAGSVSASRIAQWSGSAWSALGAGVNASVYAVTSLTTSLGPSTFAGGSFTAAGGASAKYAARWDGANWSELPSASAGIGGGFNPGVEALTVFDDDGDPATQPVIYAGGEFQEAGGVLAARIARWDGVMWSDVGGGVNDRVKAMAVFDDDGPGPQPPALFVGGRFTQAGETSATYVARWNGSAWSDVGGGVYHTCCPGGDPVAVNALLVFDDDGPGPNLPALYAAGHFTVAGGVSAKQVAKWNGAVWSALGNGFNYPIYALAAFDSDGDGPSPPSLFVGGGAPPYVFKWTGTSWQAVGGGMDNNVFAMVGFAGDGTHPPGLYAGGYFNTAGGVSAYHVARWNGQAWQALGTGTSGDVWALTIFDWDGPGGAPASLYVGGSYMSSAGGVSVNNIARWDGSAWSALGGGVINAPAATALAVLDADASGNLPPQLVVGGYFTSVGPPGGGANDRMATWGCTLAPGDADANGAVGLGDMAVLAGCLAGPAGAIPTELCTVFDFDQNHDVDLRDVASFLRVFSEN